MRLKQTMDPDICDKLRNMINLTENFQAPIDGIDGLLGKSALSSFLEYATVELCVRVYLCDCVYLHVFLCCLSQPFFCFCLCYPCISNL